MDISEILLDLHRRAHGCLALLLGHCRELPPADIDRELTGFGYPTVRLQFHHAIGAEKYWIGVLEGRLDAEEDAPRYPTIASLEAYRGEVFAATEAYLRGASPAELNTARQVRTWGGRTRRVVPAQVVVRTVTHLFHHQGQLAAMCRLLGRPCPPGLDYPLE